MDHPQYAGFWIRFAALLIDVVILLIVTSIPISFIYGADYWSSDQSFHGPWDLIINYVLPFVVTIWFWLRYFGTPGKMFLKIKIVDAKTGGKLSIGQAVGRYFAYIISAIPLLIGYLWVGFDKRKQGFHDKLAGTVVIRG